MNIHQYDLGHIKAALLLAEKGRISAQAKKQLAIAKRVIARVEETERAKHTQNYADAIGAPASQVLIDSIAADCALHGCD